MNTNERNTRSQAPSPEPHDLADRLPSPKPEPAAKPHPTSQPSPAPPQPGSPVPIPGTPDSPSPSPEPEVLPEDTSSIQDLPYSNSAALMTEIDRRLTALEKSDDLIKVTKFLQQADQMIHEEDDEARIDAFKDRLVAIYNNHECFQKYIDEITDETESGFDWEKLEHETRTTFQNSMSSFPPLSEIDFQLAHLKRIEDEIMEGCKFEERKIREITQLFRDLEAKGEDVRISKEDFQYICGKIKERDFWLSLEVESEERIRIIERLDVLSQQNPSEIDLSELENLEKSLDQIQLYHVSGMDFKTMSTPILKARILKLKDNLLQKEIGLEAFSKMQANRRRDEERKIAAKVAAGELPLEARTCGCCPETDPDEDPLTMIQGI